MFSRRLQQSASMTRGDRLKLGLAPSAAVEAFEGACNKGPERLFITESWFAPFRERLLAALPAQLNELILGALRDALYKRRRLETVVNFVELQPTTWERFAEWQADRDRERHLEEARRGYFAWEEVEVAASKERRGEHRPWGRLAQWATLARVRSAAGVMRKEMRSCPACGRPASELSWTYYSSPPSTWEHLCGREGWLGICRPCRLQVDFFLCKMN